MQINRLFEIIYILLERASITASELVTHFEVYKRTILRDICMSLLACRKIIGYIVSINVLDDKILDYAKQLIQTRRKIKKKM